MAGVKRVQQFKSLRCTECGSQTTRSSRNSTLLLLLNRAWFHLIGALTSNNDSHVGNDDLREFAGLREYGGGRKCSSQTHNRAAKGGSIRQVSEIRKNRLRKIN